MMLKAISLQEQDIFMSFIAFFCSNQNVLCIFYRSLLASTKQMSNFAPRKFELIK